MNTLNKILITNYDKFIYYKRINVLNSINDKIYLIFLHEGLGSISTWKDFPNKLCKTVKLNGIILERDGYGNSEVIFDQFDTNIFEKQIHIIKGILEKLGIEKIIFIGHSDGGTIAMLFSEIYPQKVISYISIAGHICYENQIYESLIRINSEKIIKKISIYHFDPAFVFYRWYNFWTSINIKNWDISKKLKSKISKLIIQGSKDEFATSIQYTYFKNIANTNLEIISNSGHFPHITNKEKLLSICVKFIDNLFLK